LLFRVIDSRFTVTDNQVVPHHLISWETNRFQKQPLRNSKHGTWTVSVHSHEKCDHITQVHDLHSKSWTYI